MRIIVLTRIFPKAIDKHTGAVTSKANEKLHADTTFWTLLDSGIKAGIVFVSDNFSRAILGKYVGIGNHSKNVYNALTNTIETILKYHPNHKPDIELVTDGGSENHAQNIEDFIKETGHPVFKKVIAKKDVIFSNSPVEAINKIVKRYLRHFKPKNLNELEKCIDWIINDYNNREHGALNGLTPLEVYCSKKPLDFKVQIKNAKEKRRAENKLSRCIIC